MRIDSNKTKANFVYNILYEIIRVIVPLITTPYISRVLGSYGIGEFALAQTYSMYFVMFGVLGLNSYATRELAYVRNDENRFAEVFWQVVSAKIVMMSISIAIYIFVFWAIVPDGVCNKIYLIYLISEIFNIGFYFIAVERFKTIALRNITIKAVSMVFIFMFVTEKSHTWRYTLIIVLAEVLGQIVNWISVDRVIIRKIHFSLKNFKRELSVAVSLFLPTLAIQVYTMLDKLMLGMIIGESATGFYENANKMIRLASAVASAAVAVFIPRMANDFANKKLDNFNQNIVRVFKIVSFLVFPMCVGLMAIASDFSPWYYGEDFTGIEMLFYIGSIMIVSLGWSGLFGSMILVPAGKQKYYTLGVTVGAVINFIFNVCLIPRYASNGAMIASVVAEVVGMLIMYYYVRKEFNTVGLLKKCIPYAIASGIMGAIVVFLGAILKANWITTIVEIGLGAAIYLTVLILLKDSIVNEILSMIFDKLRKR